jgi:hypothetical protein
MARQSLKEKETRPVLCRNCCIMMIKVGHVWLCQRCGLEWRAS